MPVDASKEVDHEKGLLTGSSEDGQDGSGADPAGGAEDPAPRRRRRKSRPNYESAPTAAPDEPDVEPDADGDVSPGQPEPELSADGTEPDKSLDREPGPSDYVRKMLVERYGLKEFGDLDSDEAALEYMTNAYAMALDYGPVVQEYNRHRDDFLKWKQGLPQETPTSKAPSQLPARDLGRQESTDVPPVDWELPPVDPNWHKLVRVDPDTGRFVPVSPGVSPQVAQQANARAEFLQNQYEKFWEQGPHEYLRPAIEHYARKIAEATIQETLAMREARAVEDDFLQRNKDWIFQMDEHGLPKRNLATQEPLLTDRGRQLRDLRAYAAQRYGITDPMMQTALAMDFMQQQPAPSASSDEDAIKKRDKKNKEILQRTGRQRNSRAPASEDSVDSKRSRLPSRYSGLGLRSMLLGSLNEAGITDNDLS